MTSHLQILTESTLGVQNAALWRRVMQQKQQKLDMLAYVRVVWQAEPGDFNKSAENQPRAFFWAYFILLEGC